MALMPSQSVVCPGCAQAMLLTLTASTADGWFVPALQWLADSLKLHPAVAGSYSLLSRVLLLLVLTHTCSLPAVGLSAWCLPGCMHVGITLLAMGNGANDVFTAIAALGADDFPLVLGALVGASMCISAFVLGSVIIVAKVRLQEHDAGMRHSAPDSLPSPQNGTHGVDKNAFYRDVLVYICATCVIVAGEPLGLSLALFLAPSDSDHAVVWPCSLQWLRTGRFPCTSR